MRKLFLRFQFDEGQVVHLNTKSSNQDRKSITKNITTNDTNATTNKVWGYDQVSTCRPFSLKNITCKTSKTGVDWENTNVFNFYVTQKLFKTYA